MEKTDNLSLINAAKAVLNNSYSPYSHFKVAAAVLAESGKVYTGVNIENISYPAGICAERTAISKAISEGEKKIVKIAVVSSADDITYPCGICRQVMTEFIEKDGELVFMDKNGEVKVVKLGEIMPFAFDNEF